MHWERTVPGSTASLAMRIIEMDIPGVFEVRSAPIGDARGWFMRTYDAALMREAGLHRDWVQENRSRNERAGILRGLHFQFPPSAETKLVCCPLGEVFDVFVDLRAGSPTFGRWGSVVLSEAARNAVFIPKGFAHGYRTLSEVSEVQYKVDSPYDPGREGGLLWNDPDLGIAWPGDGEPLLSTKDSTALTLAAFLTAHRGLRLAES